MNAGFIEDFQQRVAAISDNTFIYYDNGFQLYTDSNYVMRIHYPRNHFVSYVEKGDPTTLKGVFCYGTHYFIDTIENAKIEHIVTKPMWCEVIHEKNVLNDAYFLNAKMVNDKDLLRRDFVIDETIKYGLGVYLFKFLPRYGRTFIRRARNYIHKKHGS